MNFKQRVGTKISETFTETQINLKSVTNVVLTQQKMRMETCFQSATIFWKDGRITSVSYWIYTALMMLEMHTAEPLLLEPRCFGVETGVENLNRQKRELLIKFL